MQALGTHALVHTLMSSLNGCLECGEVCYCCQDKGVVAAASGWVTAGKLATLAVIEVLGH